MNKPLEGNYQQTQGFDDPCCRASYTRFGLLGHNGLDYGCPVGTPVLAPHAGIIKEATNDSGGYGLYIKVESDQEGSVLAHLSKLDVGVGTEVHEGNQVGLSGNTGNSTGQHLHWGYYRLPRNRSNGFNGFIDQTDWLNHKCPELKVSDQTKIELAEYGAMEVQAIRSTLRAKDQRIKDLESVEVQKAPVVRLRGSGEATSDSTTLSNLLTNLLIRLRKRLGG